MRARALLTVLLLAVLLCRPASAQTTAANVLAEMKDATGGAAWNRVTTLHTVSTIKGSGLTGTQDEWDDTLTGRVSVSSTAGPDSGREGYDGKQSWSQDASGQSRVVTASDDVAAAISAAYQNCFAYWFPARRSGTVSFLRHAKEGGRGFDVLQMLPTGGLPLQLWVDTKMHLPDRIVETGATATSTAFFSDYRTVHGIRLPFRTRSSTGNSRYDSVADAVSLVVNAPLPDRIFAQPPPPPPDFTITGNASSVTVPFRYEADHIFVDIKINGRGPFVAYLDTGGVYVVSPALARLVGLKAQGAGMGQGNGEGTVDVGLARAETVTIAGITLRSPLFYVIPVPALKDNPIVGYELFKRFIVRVDYDKNLLTFTLPNRFIYRGQGISVPFRFNGRIPEVDGTVDGIAGVFTIDTGAGDSIRLNRPFIEAHNLVSRYKPSYETIIDYGIGGPERGGIVHLERLTLGGVSMSRVRATLTTARGGAGADKAVAGNIGGGFLHRFNLTFDYAHTRIIFEPNSHYTEPESEDLTGLVLDPNAPDLRVADVVPNSPAALAGIKAGDVIVSINGQVLGDDIRSPLLSLFQQPAGTHLRVQVRTGQSLRTVDLILRELN